MRWGSLVVLAVVATLVCGLPAAAGAATLSDSFAAREAVQGLPIVAVGSNMGAGKEAGEPTPKPLAPAGRSVWLRWEPTGTGFVTVSTCGSETPTVLGVYQGTQLDQLTELGGVANFGLECSPLTHGVTFEAIAGLEYEILVDGNVFFVPPGVQSSGEGAISLRLEATPPPVNDDFAAAAELLGRTTEEPSGSRFYFGGVFGHNWGATHEAGEPSRQQGPDAPSVWYRWTAPASGPVRIAADGAFGRQIWLGVYGGESLESLQGIGAGADFVEFPASAGTTYMVAVDGAAGSGAGAMTSFGVRASMRLAPTSVPLTLPATAPIDSLAPQTSFRAKRVRPRARAVSFAFGASEASATFRCQLDRRRQAPCSSPKSYAGLGFGRHTFKVYAVDAAGNADPSPAATRFRISAPPRL